jgi:Transglutaminase-like enzymes, putative cysteine proteases
MRKTFIFTAFIFLFIIGALGTKAQQTRQNLKELVRTVAGDKGTNEEKTRKLVQWINTNFTWSYTDYQKRTVEEIIERRAGNCAELANVLAALLKEGNIPFRWAAEINIQPQKPERQESAAQLVAEKGNYYSVFGLMHNDHVWLEVRDEKNKTWFPADPAVGVVGLKDWLAARMAFDNRLKPVVPEVAETVKEMLVPFIVVASETRKGKLVENRSKYYVVDGFNSFYANKLAKLPAWREWLNSVEKISTFAEGALNGEVNLHEHQKEIERVLQSYEKLRQEASDKKIARK